MYKPFIVIIPARMESTRLPRKMVQLVGDMPLIILTAKQVLKSNASRVIVATDHNDIVTLCMEHNIEVVLTNTNHNSGTERIFEVVDKLNLQNDELVINIQGDEPFIPPQLINEFGSFISTNIDFLANCEFATIAHPITQKEEIFNPHIVKVVLDNLQNALYFSRSVIPYYRDGFTKESFTLPPQLNILRHIGIYGYSVAFIKKYIALPISPLEQVESLEQLRALYYGYKIAVQQTPLDLEGGIDTLDDLEHARALIGKL